MNNLKLKDIIALTILFLVAFWLWALPIQKNSLPFGEHDGAYIFSHGDYMSYVDKSSDVSGDYPISIAFWYTGYNKVLGPMTLEYPPPYLMDYAFAQIFGGERIVPVYIFIAVSCFIGIFSIYLLMRELYGFEAAILTSTAIMFSFRTALLYLWGQRHNVTAFIFIPIAIYSLYIYLDSFYKNEEKIQYLYIFVLLLICTYLVHFSATVFLIPFTLILITLMSIKNKRLPIKNKNIKHYLILATLAIIIVSQFYLIYFGADSTDKVDFAIKNIGGFFKWIEIPSNNFGMNPIFHDYSSSYMSFWSIVLLLLGVFVLLWRRKNKDLVLISALSALYAMFHLSNFGLITEGSYRIGRYLVLENYFFYSIMVIGLLFIPDLVKVPKQYRSISKLLLTVFFLIILVSTQGSKLYDTLNDSYEGVLRITPVQYELSEWIQENIPEDSALYIRGTLTYPKKAFVQILSRRTMERGEDIPLRREILSENIIKDNMKVLPQFVRGTDWVIPLDYVIFDYTDILAIGNQQMFDSLTQMEETVSKNASVIYNKNNIKVYKYN